MFGRIFLGLLGIGIGFLITWKSEWIIQNFGSNDWAERTFGASGGSRLFYKLIGVAIIFLGVLHLTGLLGGFFSATLGWLFIPTR